MTKALYTCQGFQPPTKAFSYLETSSLKAMHSTIKHALKCLPQLDDMLPVELADIAIQDEDNQNPIYQPLTLLELKN